VHENCTAFSGHHRIVIIAQHDDDVVYGIRPPQYFGTARKGLANVLVVERVGWVVTPSIARGQRCDRQGCFGWCHAIRSIQDAAERHTAGGRCAVTLNLVVADAVGADNAGNILVLPLKRAGGIKYDVDGTGWAVGINY